jgi:hypothetical protein
VTRARATFDRDALGYNTAATPSGLNALSDLRRVARATSALAPASGVDCRRRSRWCMLSSRRASRSLWSTRWAAWRTPRSDPLEDVKYGLAVTLSLLLVWSMGLSVARHAYARRATGRESF